MKAAAVVLFTLAPLVCAQNGGTIDGRVTNSVTGEGVAGVRARFLNRGYVYEASTDSSGAYHLTNLADGDYSPEFMKDGYSQNTRGRVHVSGGIPATFDIQMRPWGALRGRVLDEDGNPVAGVKLEIGRGITDDVSTNASSEFAFKELAPGSYILAAKPPAKIRVQDGVRLGTVTIYYPSGTEPSQAVPIVVRTGEDVAGIEIRLKSVPVHRIAGVILDPAGMPVPNATVKLLGRAGAWRQSLMMTPIVTVRPADVRNDGLVVVAGARGFELGSAGSITTIGPSPEPVVAQVESRKDGSFEFAAVESGEWRVSAVADLYEGTPLGNVVSALVGEKDLDDLQVRMATAIPVRGAAGFDGPNPPPLPGGAPNLEPIEGQEHVYYSQPGTTGKRPGNLPGRYRVMPGPVFQFEGLYAAAILWQGRDVMGQVVELEPGEDAFQVIYKSGTGAVRGTVENGAGSLVLLIPREARDLIDVRSIQCNADGAFAFSNIPPGDYGIVALGSRRVGAGTVECGRLGADADDVESAHRRRFRGECERSGEPLALVTRHRTKCCMSFSFSRQ